VFETALSECCLDDVVAEAVALAMSDEDDQTDELLALSSIFGDLVFSSQRDCEGLMSGILKASVECPHSFQVKLDSQGNQLLV